MQQPANNPLHTDCIKLVGVQAGLLAAGEAERYMVFLLGHDR